MRRVYSWLRRLWATCPHLVLFTPLLLRRLLRGPGPRPEPTPRRRAAGPRASAVRNDPVDLVVFSIIRNGVSNGYPFVEAYGSWLGRADRILVLDGTSDDGTREALDELAAIDASVVVVSAPWPAEQRGGAAIAEMTNAALALARDGGRRLVFAQADEIYTDAQRALLAGHDTGGALRLAGCVNFWNSFDAVIENEFPMRYVRAFPATADAHALADGFSFEIAGIEEHQTPERFLHYGWCFPVNILRKHVNHAALYHDDPGYRLRGALARLMLEERRYDPRLLEALAPQYRPVPYTGEHPLCMRHLLTLSSYDPEPGLALLRSGVRW